ncbi:MAG: hypothetical protein MUC81_07585 [Bacteroidia bacterium]|jgi:hypothetical protein|nr:hypothetical protein [Bacteroidia bacterium]
MKTLNVDWFYTNLPDTEYKRYILLAYLQSVHAEFNHLHLYPALADLIKHYNNLQQFKKQKEQLYQSFPDYISSIDLKHFHVNLTKQITDDELMKHLDEVIEYSIPLMQKHLDEGKELYEFIEREIELIPIGILPIYRKEGYLMFKREQILVYEYELKLFEHASEIFRSISTKFITDYHLSFLHTAEYIKRDIINQNKKLPNPAFFYVESAHDYPVHTTVLPITKRLLLQYVA